MGLVTVAAGAYTGTYTKPSGSAQSLGVMGDDGFRLSMTPHGQMLNDTDQYGQTLIEVIYRGVDWRVGFQTKEWLQGLKDVIGAYGEHSSGVTPKPQLGVIGRKGTDIAGALILTDVDSTPAATLPASLTAASALLAPNSNLSMSFTSKIREVPVEMLLLPYTSTNIVPFVTV